MSKVLLVAWREFKHTALTKAFIIGAVATPLMGAAVARNHAYLALATAALGDRKLAERHLRRALPRLRALGQDDLVERCEAAVGRA